MNLQELIDRRAKIVHDMHDFLDTHGTNGVLSAEDDATYTKMEKDLDAVEASIKRLETLNTRTQILNQATSTPITSKPTAGTQAILTGRASDAYKSNFWNFIRSRAVRPEVLDALSEGTDASGGYLVPDEFEKTLVKGLSEANIMRQICKVIRTSSGERKIPVVASTPEASWIEENGKFEDATATFSQKVLSAHKLGLLIKVSEELLQDSAFDMQAYLAGEFADAVAAKEEEAFIAGTGTGQPKGFLEDATAGVTAAKADAITADELMDLFYALKRPYRARATWMLNDATIKSIRKLKDGNGNYLWQPALTAGQPNMILGRPVQTSAYMPTAAAEAKTVAFGDFSYYWIADRQGRVFRRLNELYAENGQVGFRAHERVDGTLVLPEAIVVLSQAAS